MVVVFVIKLDTAFMMMTQRIYQNRLQIYNIDGLVIGSSTIASNVPGVLKSFIDRGHFVVEQLLYDKYTLCVATYENYGGYSAFRVLKNLVLLP